MTDVYSKEKRSYVMSKICSKNTKPEILVRKYLFKQGFRFRVNVKRLPGTPDIVLRKYRSVIFVHGCFWHGHGNCPVYVPPKTHSEYWLEKINKKRGLRKKLTQPSSLTSKSLTEILTSCKSYTHKQPSHPTLLQYGATGCISPYGPNGSESPS